MRKPVGPGELSLHWRVVVAASLGAAAGITGMSVYALTILIGPLSEAFGWSRAEVAGAKTVVTAGFVLTAPFIGWAVDRFGVRTIGLVSLTTLGLGFLAMTRLGPSLTAFYVALFALALAGCGTTALVWTRAVATWFERSRGLALALTLTGPGATGIIAPLLLDALIRRYDWRAAYIALAVFSALALVPAFLWFRENASRASAGERDAGSTDAELSGGATGLTLAAALRTVRFWQIGFGFLLVGAVVSALLVHLVPLIIDAGVPREVAVRVAGLFGLAVVVGRVVTGWLVDRFHPPMVAAVLLGAPIIGCLMLIGGPSSTLITSIAVACIGLAAGSEIDLVPFFTARYFGLRAYGRIYSWMFVTFYAGVGVGPLALGHAYDLDGSYTRGLQYAIPVLALGVTVIGLLGRPPKFT